MELNMHTSEEALCCFQVNALAAVSTCALCLIGPFASPGTHSLCPNRFAIYPSTISYVKKKHCTFDFIPTVCLTLWTRGMCPGLDEAWLYSAEYRAVKGDSAPYSRR